MTENEQNLQGHLSKRVFVIWYKNLLAYLKENGFETVTLKAEWEDEAGKHGIDLGKLEAEVEEESA